VVIGDLGSGAEARSLADQVNAIGRMDAVIHNARISSTKGRLFTPEGHATILAVNILAPYILTARIARPRRLVYLSSSMHRGGIASLRDIGWVERRWNSSQAYSDSRLYLTALAFAVARCWPDVLAMRSIPAGFRQKWAVPGAPDDFEQGYRNPRGVKRARLGRRDPLALACSTLSRVRESARLLKMTGSWVYEHVKPEAEDRLPSVKLGKYLRFHPVVSRQVV
jgi:NAD(P)-dependent dehydrogenase (short-subunit alcohol dehydrogenase family)